MKTAELRGVLVSFAGFERDVRSECYAELERFIDVVPQEGTETTAAFVKRLRARLDGGKISAPQSLVDQLNAIKTLLISLGAKKSLHEDVAHIQQLFASSSAANMDALVRQLEAARDYVAPPVRPRREGTSGGTARGSSAKAVVESYVKRLEQAALRPAEFEAILKELKSQVYLADDKVKQIANKLHPSPSKSPLRPKSREDAFRRILEYQHRKAHSESSRRALELTPL